MHFTETPRFKRAWQQMIDLNDSSIVAQIIEIMMFMWNGVKCVQKFVCLHYK